MGELTQSQIAVILRLESGGPATTSGLARAEGMRPQSMGSIVVALQSAGMIQGVPDSSDGRQTVLSLTDACRKRLQEGRAMRQDWLSKTIATKLSSEEREQLASHLKLLMRLVED
ncbi:MarR family transcriptional regulator [Rhizobium sp. BK376]|nr:MarR family transcriptional regulator [Rhizobium sp. BK376]